MNNHPASSDRSGWPSFDEPGTAEEIMLRQAARIARLGFFSFSTKTDKVEICSARHAEIFGLSPKAFIEKATGIRGDMSMVHPDDAEILREAYAKVQAGETVEIAYRFRRADGSWGVISEHVAPEFDEAGHVVRALGSSRDITDMRQRDEEVMQSDQLETLGVLTAGVAHDFNNLLAVIMGNAQLGAAHDPSPLMRELLDEIVEATHRGARLTKSLLAFAQRATIVPREIKLNDALADAIKLFASHLPDGITISTDFSGADPRLFVDADQLQTVLFNILENAVEASKPPAEIFVSTAVQSSSMAAQAPDEASAPGECLIVIKDHGKGIEPGIVSRVTDPFFTTKNRAKGSGLGLSMAHGFARQSGGSLELESAPEEGTTVRLRFPCAAGADGDDKDSPSGGQTKRVLLLEDDAAVRDVLCRQMHRLGCTVTAVQRPEQVFEQLALQTFDLAVLDYIVAGSMNGVEVARTMRQRGIKLPIILLTGMPNKLSDQHLSYVDALLHKPVPIATLSQQINQCLAKSR